MSDAAEKTPAPSRLALAEAVVVVGVALWCAWFQLRMPGLTVEEPDCEAVARVLRQEAQAGDAVLLYPWWTERARTYVPEGLPVIGYQGSDDASLELHPRIWVLAQPRQPRADLDDFRSRFGRGRTSVGPARTFGNLSLQLFENGRARPLRFSALGALSAARAYLERPNGDRTPCAWNGRAHRCPNGAEVSAQWHEIDFAPHRCLRLPPPGGDARLVLEFVGVPATEELALLAGYTWERGYYHGTVGDSDLALEVNGTSTPLALPAGEFRLRRIEAPQTPEASTVRVWAHADNPLERDVCVELYGFGSRR